MPEIDLAVAIETNWIKLGTLEMEANYDRMVVVQDDFRFGTECLRCRARDIRMISQTEQRSVVRCDDCVGTGRVLKAGSDNIMVNCVTCDRRGWIVCPECNGTGAEEGLIAHPQDREQRPTTGTIVSVGEKVVKFKRGESIIYPSFVGHFWDLEAEDVNGNIVKVTIGILREDEALARVKGHLELRRVKRSASLGTAA